jgi:hypothetical protein
MKKQGRGVMEAIRSLTSGKVLMGGALLIGAKFHLTKTEMSV